LEAWRLFIAIEIPAHVRQLIQQHIDRLRTELPDIRASWTREENLHLTLKFLGNTAVGAVEDVSRAVKRAAGQIKPFELTVAGSGYFPPRGKPKVLWIGTSDASSNIGDLHQYLEDECERLGFARENRSFHPHLTIARLRDSKGGHALAELHSSIGFAPVQIQAEDACLIRSELSSQGSRYSTIARHRFGLRPGSY
jgi:2'-5' RNA ligase